MRKQDFTLSKVREMTSKLMATDFEVQGQVFNMNKLNWRFEFNNKKSSFGVCSSRRIRKGLGVTTLVDKKIKLSMWLIQNSSETLADWENTMLHEIAHAIDKEIRGKSNHDWHWRTIALSIGCDGKRCGSTKVDAKESKYTLKCHNCGEETASHRRKKRLSACGNCCRKHNGGRYTAEFKLTQIQNY
jgi:ribosomal protein L37AE/L43A